MLKNIELKLATIEDLPAIQEVGDRLFDYDIKPNRAREFFNDPRHHLVLAYYKGDVVAMASAFQYVHPDKDPALFINEVGVLDEFQSHGIGRTIVKYLYEYGLKLGCKEIWVATENSNIAARKAFTAAGGVEDKEPIVLITFNTENSA